MKKFLLRCALSRSLRALAEIKEQSDLLRGFYHILHQSSMVLIIADKMLDDGEN
jgi:hypothetical protein